ncbi:HNH endonuclease [Demequina lutea]|uniref:HNH nuclease domain-containing protein n=1 Tax=Demequina lutea TaxID=431489 RepID=A0A7Y9Z7V4_9MICO|nr:HNH endonuclease signature motif containing protein [Demequina lutea]NYI40384.1 hypothetical protein [Demequina lutea]
MEISTGATAAALGDLAAFEGRAVAGLEDGELIAALGAAALVVRTSEATLAALAFQVGQRSAPDLGPSGLAREHGFSSPGRMVAHATGGSLGDAAHLIDAGRAFAPRTMPDGLNLDGANPGGLNLGGANVDGANVGDPAPAPSLSARPQPAYPRLATCLAAGDIGAAAAALVGRTLDTLGEQAQFVEERLVERACELDLGELRRVCQRLEASSDPVAWEARERRQYEARHVSISEDHDGMLLIHARLDPPSAAPVVAWLDAQVKDAFRRRRDGDPLDADTRTVGQIRADALVGLARHGMACDEPTSGVSTTMVVRIGLDELLTGTGLGESDNLTAPLSAGAIRVIAADAEIIPAVLGANSEVLDIGRQRRLFTRAQRLALVERDGGCAMCHAPPSYCEAHHIRWWRHLGGTDLDNGVLLCTACHHRVHRDGWHIESTRGQVWITPPPSVDPTGKRRLGGRARMQLAA